MVLETGRWTGSEEDLIRLLDAVEMIVHDIDLMGDAGVAARHAFELLSETEANAHLGTIQGHDSSACAVNTHHRCLRHLIQHTRMAHGRIADAIQTHSSDQSSPPRLAPRSMFFSIHIHRSESHLPLTTDRI